MNFAQFLKSRDIIDGPVCKSVEPIIDSKISNIVGQMPREAVVSLVANKKIKEIIEKLSAFNDSAGIIGDYLIEFDIRKNSDLLTSARNIRFKGFNLLLILYLYGDDLVKDYIILEGVEPTREDIFLGELLSGITHEGDKEINNLLKLEDYIEQIYKTGEVNFDVNGKIIDKTFIEFLLATYSYYLQFGNSIKGGNLVHHIIYDFLGNLLNNNKLHFDKNIILKYIDELSKGLPSVSFYKGMYMLKRLFEDYNEGEEIISPKVLNALAHYNEQLKMSY
ncbi:MAG: hypothetical protein PHV23_04540 [Candidatus Gracilibacteria bacterium]|nr:hypothetical protein [Candidatus Gracilibacteria bacterium]